MQENERPLQNRGRERTYPSPARANLSAAEKWLVVPNCWRRSADQQATRQPNERQVRRRWAR